MAAMTQSAVSTSTSADSVGEYPADTVIDFRFALGELPNRPHFSVGEQALQIRNITLNCAGCAGNGHRDRANAIREIGQALCRSQWDFDAIIFRSARLTKASDAARLAVVTIG